MTDVELVEKLGNGRVDYTIGSALDIFGGKLSYESVVNFDKQQRKKIMAPRCDGSNSRIRRRQIVFNILAISTLFISFVLARTNKQHQ